MTIHEMIENIEIIISQCDSPEIEVMEALETLSEGWRMRAQELRDEEE